MKRTIIASILASSVFLSASIAYAETASSTAKTPIMKVLDARLDAKVEARQDMHADIKTIKTEGKIEIRDLRARIASSTAAIKMKIASTTKDIRNKIREGIEIRKENRYAEMLRRYQATIDRETEILDKVNSRISKMKEQGEDTSAAEKLTMDAKIQLDGAANSLADLIKMSDELPALPVSSTTAQEWKDDLASMRKVGIEIDTHLKASHLDLVKSVQILRLILHPAMASTTPATATTTNN